MGTEPIKDLYYSLLLILLLSQVPAVYIQWSTITQNINYVKMVTFRETAFQRENSGLFRVLYIDENGPNAIVIFTTI